MKRIVLVAMMLLLAGPVAAENLEVGMKAPDFSFEDADGNVFTLNSWAGKVLLINYVDPDEADMNDHFTDAMKKAVDTGRLSRDHYKGIGIADCAAAPYKPNFLIRTIAGKKAKKYHTTILFDYDASLRNSWGLTKDSANAVLLDKTGTCRFISRGRVPDAKVAEVVDLAIALQQP